ncbi:MAG: DeoR family transcriptional regulator [Desulfurococcales archaeon]|nr:DeoR family transcriptional regulator [Desulfurococcales archaeon]
MAEFEEIKFARLRVNTNKKVEELMENALEGFIGLDESTKELVIGSLLSECKVSAADKILIGLLGYKAMSIIGWRETDTVSVKELSEKLGINYNTVRSELSRLAKEKYVIPKARGYYSINTSLIENIAKRIINSKRKCTGNNRRK